MNNMRNPTDAHDNDGVITCRQNTALACDAYDRTLAPAEARQLAMHLADCPLCRTANKQFQTLSKLLDEFFGKTPTA